MMEQMAREHAAWLDVVKELRTRGAGDINQGEKDEPLHNAIVKWGEELATLRSTHDETMRSRALAEKRALYEGQFERGTYPEGE